MSVYLFSRFIRDSGPFTELGVLRCRLRSLAELRGVSLVLWVAVWVRCWLCVLCSISSLNREKHSAAIL